MAGRVSRLTSSITRASVSACRTAALYRWQFEKGGQTAQIDVSGPITLDEASLARTAVLEGIGLGFFMEQDVRADIEAGRLVRVLEDWTPPFAGLCLYYPGRRNPSAALKAFIGLARELSAKSRSQVPARKLSAAAK